MPANGQASGLVSYVPISGLFKPPWIELERDRQLRVLSFFSPPTQSKFERVSLNSQERLAPITKLHWKRETVLSFFSLITTYSCHPKPKASVQCAQGTYHPLLKSTFISSFFWRLHYQPSCLHCHSLVISFIFSLVIIWIKELSPIPCVIHL